MNCVKLKSKHSMHHVEVWQQILYVPNFWKTSILGEIIACQVLYFPSAQCYMIGLKQLLLGLVTFKIVRSCKFEKKHIFHKSPAKSVYTANNVEPSCFWQSIQSYICRRLTFWNVSIFMKVPWFFFLIIVDFLGDILVWPLKNTLTV